jgi:hypothetical protein
LAAARCRIVVFGGSGKSPANAAAAINGA